MSELFNSSRRQARRQQEAQKAATRVASQRTNFRGALYEVLDSISPLTLRVGEDKINGHEGSCTIKGSGWYGPEFFVHEVKLLREQLGRRYDVVGCAWISVERVPFSVAMDFASGYSNPRLHAIEHDTVMVKLRQESDISPYQAKLAYPVKHWITITRK